VPQPSPRASTALVLLWRGEATQGGKPMNSDKRDVRSDFTDVDRASDPGHLVRFLNTVSALDVIRAYKRRSFDLLGLQPGQVVLDLGCGNGDDVRELAQLVGTTGRVVGVDRSETLIATALERLGEDKLPVEFQVGDACGLNFPNEMFDGCRADRVFHHMVKPEQGMAELVRVARSGARVVTIDPDFETAIVDAPDPALTRTLLNLNCDSYRNGQIGRHMRAMFIEAGLIDVDVEPLTVLLEDYGLAKQVLALEGTVTQGTGGGAGECGRRRALVGHPSGCQRGRAIFRVAHGVHRGGPKVLKAHARSVLNEPPPPELHSTGPNRWFLLDDPAAARAAFEREITQPRLVAAPTRRLALVSSMAGVHARMGDLVAARQLVRELGSHTFAQDSAMLAQPLVDFCSGDWESAGATWAVVREQCRTGNRWGVADFAVWLARLNHLQGDSASARRDFTEALSVALDGPMAPLELKARAGLALLAVDQGTPREARSQLCAATNSWPGHRRRAGAGSPARLSWPRPSRSRRRA
jgi:ubiquinone/menaquinone biosynthesis C-methylase UbiE